MQLEICTLAGMRGHTGTTCGSTVNLLDETGGRVVSYWYDDFVSAAEVKTSGYSDFVNEIQYTGAVYDELTGLLYLNARAYDPTGKKKVSGMLRYGNWYVTYSTYKNPIVTYKTTFLEDEYSFSRDFASSMLTIGTVALASMLRLPILV